MTTKIFVHTPFQVICAAEFMAARPEGSNGEVRVFLLPIGSSRNVQQARETAERLEVPFRSLGGRASRWGRLQRLLALRREVAALTSRDTMVIGNPALDMLAAALFTTPAEKWVLDDGVMSVRFLQALADGGSGWQGPPESRASRVVSRLLFGSPPRDWRKAHWFTVFARHFEPSAAIHLNDFSSLRARCRFSGIGDTVLFLGSPLVRERLFTAESYDFFCRTAAAELRAKHPGCTLVYLRHRAEGDAERAAYGHFDTVQESTGPVELRWLGTGANAPAAVGGILSTALISLSELLPEAVRTHVYWPDASVRILEPRFDPADLLPLFERVARQGRLELRMIGVSHAENRA